MEYKLITNCIKDELCIAKSILKEVFAEKKYFGEELFSFMEESKKIRSSLVFLILNCLNIKPDRKHFFIAIVVELMHCASLIHDDIIDDAKKRRNKLTFNQRYGNSVAVILGDYLFSFVVDILGKINNKEISDLFYKSMETMCEGEFEQYFETGKIPELQKYIEKSYQKTGILFETSIKAALFESEYKDKLAEFTKNFGIGFQLKDDFNNIYKSDLYIDIKEKIYTAPVIFAYKDYPDILNLSENEIVNIIKQEKYKKKTQELVKSYFKAAIEKIDFLQDNEYKTAIKNLCKFIGED